MNEYLELEKLFLEKHKEFVTISNNDDLSASVKAKRHEPILKDMQQNLDTLNAIYSDLCDYYNNVKKSVEYVESLYYSCSRVLGDEKKENLLKEIELKKIHEPKK